MNDNERKRTRDEFADAVNMTPKELRNWLDSDQSKSVGQSKNGGESVGHEMGRHIITVLNTKTEQLTDEQYRQMRKVIGFVHRHRSRWPKSDVADSKWRYSLMNWGNDPLKS